jgi:RNA polymerase sigma factor (TIGR02999 family)
VNDVTLLLDALGRGEGEASKELLPLVYDELRNLAAGLLLREVGGQTLQPTALVHDAWLRLAAHEERNWNNRDHFFRAAAQCIRRILVDRARQKSSIKRGSRGERLNIDDLQLVATTPDDRILLIDEALERLEVEKPESAKVITLKFFCGFTNKEIAEIQGVTERTVERQWTYAKACLVQIITDSM